MSAPTVSGHPDPAAAPDAAGIDDAERGRSLAARWERAVAAEFAAQPLRAPGAPLAPADLIALPAPVRRYVERSGALGRPRPRNMRVVLAAKMYRAPGGPPLPSRSVQHTFFDRPARLFLMTSRMYGLPVRALHLYRREQATFTVRVASLVSIVDQRGPEISAAETVTVLNDLCLMAPGALVDERLTWREVDDRQADVVFTNGPHRVRATLRFNERDELVDFVSDDRPDSGSGRFVSRRWRTPVDEYRDVDGLHLLHRGGALYERPDGPFTYGEFALDSIAYDLAGPVPASG
jgi:hypothetical protein